MADPKRHLELSLAYIDARAFAEAREEARIAVRLAPHQSATWLQYAKVEFVDRRNQRARRLFGRAVNIDPEDGDARMWLGILHARFEDFDAAEACMERAVLDSPWPELVEMAFADDVLWRSGQYERADKHFLRALELNPESVYVRQRYAEMLVLHGRLGEARQRVREALEIDSEDKHTLRLSLELETLPQDEFCLDDLRCALHRDPSYEAARKAIERFG